MKKYIYILSNILLLYLFIAVSLYGCGGGGGGGITPSVSTSTPTPLPTGVPVDNPTPTGTPVVVPTAIIVIPTSTPVPGRPVLYSVADSDGNNWSPVITSSAISFTLRGINFGSDAAGVTVTFIDLNNISYTAVVTSCRSDVITGNINLPAGKYVIRVKTSGGTSGQDVYYFKGEGDVEIIVG